MAQLKDLLVNGDSRIIGTLLVDKRSGGHFLTPIHFQSESLPQKTLEFVCGIDSFANGGQLGWQTKGDFLSGVQSDINDIRNTYLKLSGGALTGNIVISKTGNPYYEIFDGTTRWFFQAIQGDNACYIGPTAAKAIKIDVNGNTAIRAALTVAGSASITGNISGAIITGTLLKTTAATAVTATEKIATLDSNGQICYITPANLAGSSYNSLYARLNYPNDFVHSSNEITMVGSGYSGALYYNYRTTGGTNGNITEYHFGNGKGGTLATISAGQFSGNAASASKLTVNSGSIDNPVYFSNGVPVASMWYVGDSGHGTHDCNAATYDFCGYYTSNGPATSLGATTADGALWSQAYNSTWVAQIAQDYRNGTLFVRGKNNGTWQAWDKIVRQAGTHTFSGANTFTAGLTVSGRTVGSGDDEGVVIGTAANGYAGLCLGSPSGRRSVFYLNNDGNPFWRYNTGSASYDIKHPGKSGTIALTTDVDTKISEQLVSYLPISGGNMTGAICTSFKSSTAMGSYQASANTVEALAEEVRYSSGCMGSVSITTAYAAGNGGTIASGWYNFIYSPHRSGGSNGAASGDNHNYGTLILAGMTANLGLWHIRISSGAIAKSQKIWEAGDAVTGAVWNDYAECREANTIEPGYVLVETGDDSLTKSTERLSPFAGISSDTWGFSQGETDKAKTPIAVAGRVLAYPYQDRNNYKPGDCVCAAPGGTVDIMTREEIIQWPDRIVGTVSSVPEYEEWGDIFDLNRLPVKINGRIWIKVH